MNLFQYILSKPDGEEVLARWRAGFIECSTDGFYNWLERREFVLAAQEIDGLLAERRAAPSQVYKFSRA